MYDYILIKTGLNRLLARRDEEGASAVEYGLLVAGIAALSSPSSSSSAA